MSISRLALKNNAQIYAKSFSVDNRTHSTKLTHDGTGNSDIILPDVTQGATDGYILTLVDPVTGATEWKPAGDTTVSYPIAIGIYKSNYTGMNGTDINSNNRAAQKIFYAESVGAYPGGDVDAVGYIDDKDYVEIKYDTKNTRCFAPATGVYNIEINAVVEVGADGGTHCFEVRRRDKPDNTLNIVKYFGTANQNKSQKCVTLGFDSIQLVGGTEYAVYYKLVGSQNNMYCTYCHLKLVRTA